MNTIRIFCLLLILSSLIGKNSYGQYLYLDSALTISTSTTYDSVRITLTGRLTADDSIAVLGDMIIDSGGVVTHSLRLFTGLRMNVLGLLDVKTGGAIDVSGQGLLGGAPAIGGNFGEAYNTAGDSIVPGASGSENTGGGGSYGGKGGAGGQGGVSNEPYGFIEYGRQLGAGGGSNRYYWGGNGGGSIEISAVNCVINGTIRANGGAGSGGFDNSGGGSGGSIRMSVGTLSGSGTIEAIGGAASSWDIGGCGGGGRIAIFYNSFSLPLSDILAHSGTGGSVASAGTIYMKDNAELTGEVIVNNGNIDCPLYTPWLSTLPTFQKLSLQSRARMRTGTSDDAVFDEVNLESNSVLLLDTNTAVQTPVIDIDGAILTTNVDRSFPVGTDLQLTGNGTINVQNNRTLNIGSFDTTNMKSGTLNIQQGSRLDVTTNRITIGGWITFVKDGSLGALDSINVLTIDSGGVLTHSTRLLEGLRLKALDTLEIKQGGNIDVSAKGLLGGRNITYLGGPGETFNTSDLIVAGALGSENQCAGASYGGYGADASTVVISNPPYGLLEEPRHLGSGGGGNRYFVGGNGGGRITIEATNCIIDGSMKANGGSGSSGFDPSGGGSGGTVMMVVGNLSGTGTIESIGGAGNSYTYYSGSGGGGRVAIYYDKCTLPTENIKVRGGSGSGAPASAGTLYLKDSVQLTGNVIIDNGEVNSSFYTTWQSALPAFQSLTLGNRAQLRSMVGDAASFENVIIASNSILLLDTNSAFVTPVVQINGATLTLNIDRSFPVGTDLQLAGNGTINVQNNRTFNIGLFDTTNMKSGTLNIQQGSRLDVTTNRITIGGGVTFVKDGMIGELDSIQALTIDSGGVLTHSIRLLAGLKLKVVDTLNIRQGGKIDVSGKGLLGGVPVGVAGGPGEAYDANDSIITGAGGAEGSAAGGSHGGRGAGGSQGSISNTPYGYIENVRHLGAGGGGNRYFVGGNGGGLVNINANICILSGTILANGQSGSSGFDNSGGGSGGGIKLVVKYLTGAGSIQAIGGGAYSWTKYGGSGSGGRIAILYEIIDIPLGNITARGGTGGANASAGTVYFKVTVNNHGDVIIDNANIVCDLFTPWMSDLSTINNLNVIGAGKLEVGTELYIEGQILVAGNSKIGRP